MRRHCGDGERLRWSRSRGRGDPSLYTPIRAGQVTRTRRLAAVLTLPGSMVGAAEIK